MNIKKNGCTDSPFLSTESFLFWGRVDCAIFHGFVLPTDLANARPLCSSYDLHDVLPTSSERHLQLLSKASWFLCAFCAGNTVSIKERICTFEEHYQREKYLFSSVSANKPFIATFTGHRKRFGPSTKPLHLIASATRLQVSDTYAYHSCCL